MSDSFYDLQVPAELQEVARRHQQHLAELVSKLRMVGMDDKLIERSVDQLISSYKAQLLDAIKTLGEPYRA